MKAVIVALLLFMSLVGVVAAIFMQLGFLTRLLDVKVGGAENPWAFLLFLLFRVGDVVAQIQWFWYKKQF